MFKNTLFFKPVDKELIYEYISRLNSEIKSKEIGYYELPHSEEGTILKAKELKDSFRDLENIVVLGTGGSSLGTKAIRSLLLDKDDKNLIFLENLDPIATERKLANLNFEKSIFLIISKSGTTVETISLLKVLLQRFNLSVDSKEFQKRFIVITDKNSPLDNFANKFNLKSFYIPHNVGGRFSVFSAAGLVPLTLAGIDSKGLLEGAKESFVFFQNEEFETIMQKAFRYAIHKQASINVLFSYGDIFADFNDWYVQLWAESLGKKDGYSRLGLTPIALIGSTDQHSFLQLLMEGPKDKTVTFLKILNWDNEMSVPKISLDFLKECDFCNELKLESLLNTQCSATMQSIIQEGITTDLIELDRLDAWHIGFLMYYYELLTSTCGLMLGINTYNQPGVEVGKRILKSILKVKK